MNLNDIMLFVQVVEAGSFAGAGRRLRVPANSISRRIQDLETALGARLLRRSTRRMTLTDAGRNLYDESAERLQAVQQSALALVDAAEEPSGTIRIAAPADVLDIFGLDWIAEFLGAYPRVSIEFRLSDDRADLLDEGIDLAFRTSSALDLNLIARKIGTSRVMLVASPLYLDRRGRPAAAAELADHDCITLAAHGRPATWRLEGPAGIEEVVVAGRFAASTMRGVAAAAAADLGIALVPPLLVRDHLNSGALSRVLPSHGGVEAGAYFAYLPGRVQPKAVRAFIDFAVGRLQAKWAELDSQLALP
jgi:LysR family transcriptional regulator AphB